MMKLIKYPSKEQWAELLKRPALNTESLFDTVRTIINKVRAEGDKAVLEYFYLCIPPHTFLSIND